MQNMSRKLIAIITTSVFIVLVPFLIVYSLGYNIQLNQKTLENSFTVRVDTLPFGAEIRANNKKLANSPADLQTSPKNYIFLDITKENYVSESFELKGDPKNNTGARVNNLWMLPKTPIVTKEASNRDKQISIIDKYLISYNQRQNQYFVTALRPDLSTFETKDITLNNIDKIGTSFSKTDSFCYLDSITQQSFLNFEDSRMLIDWTKPLTNKESKLIFPFKSLKSQTCLNSQNIWLLDTQNQLWRYNAISNTIIFVDNQIDSLNMDLQTKYIWLRKSDIIYRVGGNNPESFGVADIYLRNIFLKSESDTISNISTIFQGVSLLSGSNLIVIYDNDKSIQYISRNAKVSVSSDNAIFWLDTDNNLFVWNFILKQNLRLGTINLQTGEVPTIVYNNESKRVFIYIKQTNGQTTIHSVWYNKDVLNDYIVKYSYITWLNDLDSASNEIHDKYQYTLKNNKLEVYKLDNLL